jgi:ATP-binding cassette subfamily F protein 3
VGVNGAGKSTLCRLISGIDFPTDGSLKTGHNVTVDYFAQEADFHLDSANTVLSEMEAESGAFPQATLRGMLGAFLFSGDDVYKPIPVLSGGEKSRLALAKMLLRPSNFMILDEPTNHLDADSKNVLLDALKHYDGTLLVVSHDRYFLDRLIERVLEIDAGQLRDWPGNLSEYLSRKHLFDDSREQQRGESERIPFATRAVSAPKTKDQKRAEAEIRNRFSQDIRKAQLEAESLQRKIDGRESRKAQLEAMLADERVYHDGDKSKDILAEYQKIRSELPELFSQWEKAALKAEELERERDQLVNSLG